MTTMPMRLLLLTVCCLLMTACHRGADDLALLRRADALWQADADSTAALLAQVERPELLPRTDRLRYGWLKAYRHYEDNVSMTEDSLVLPAFDYFTTQGDTARLLTSYLLKAAYLHARDRHREELAVLDSGSVRALALGDTTFAGDLLAEKGECYVYTYKDYPRAAAAYRSALALRESADNHFSLGITLGLMKADSAAWHTDLSVQMAMQRGDTARAIHYLRNHAQLMAYVTSDYPAAIRLFHRLMALTDRADVLDISCFTLSECFLKVGLLDSAQYYLDKGQAYYRREGRKFVTSENLIGYLQGLIDYTRTGTFDNLDLMRYNDSVGNALYALHSTIRQKNHTRDELSGANLRLLVDRQRMQLWLLGALLLLLLGAGTAFYCLRRRRARLIEAEERIETLDRLLAEASAAAPVSASIPADDDRLLRRTLLQQLGLIRLVAGQPTAQNQELLRRFSTLPHPGDPAEGLLVWGDLYPLIDRLYDGFHARLVARFGTLLTDKEQQLCCLLRADFTTKEISVLTAQSVPTIYQRKTTIRKKLGMDEKGDIIAFLETGETAEKGCS